MTLEVSLTHRFEAFSLQVEVTAAAGITAIFGRSGAGKTTLANAVAGLVSPVAGRISLAGVVLFDSGLGINVPPQERRIGYVFQDGRLFPHLSVLGNLKFGARFAGEPVTVAQEKRIIDMLGLGPLLSRRPATLSGGEQQRVAIGRALLSAPQLLIMDEPLAALDELRKAEILPYLERLRDETTIPIIYVSHHRDEILQLADLIFTIEDGVVTQELTPGEFRKATQRPGVKRRDEA